jgi:steroid 5-alpha reductase family enzyme
MPANGLRVFVVSRGVRHVASGIVRYDRNVIAYLLILWKARLGIERIARRDIRRPCHATIGAK